VSDTQVLDDLLANLKASAKTQEAALKKVTDTRLIWTLCSL
jgi:hypothetical protein